MGRCGCGGDQSVIKAGDNVSVDGSGTSADPYIIGATQVDISGTPTDGQTMVWSSTLGKWIPTNPSGASELAYIENSSGANIGLAANSGGDVTGSISVPPSTRPVWLRAGLAWQLTSVGVGSFSPQLIEVISGSPSVLLVAYLPVRDTATSTWSNLRYSEMTYRLGPTTTTRTFKLSAYLIGDSGSPVVTIANGARPNASALSPSWLLAEAK